MRYLNPVFFASLLWLLLAMLATPAAAEILNDVTGATTAYALRRLDTNYTGTNAHAITVRRSSDNATQDIGFDTNGNLDTTALLTFVGTSATDNGYVVTWYDQTDATTAGMDISEETVSQQPQIVSAGTVVRAANGLPAVNFSGSQVLSVTYATSLTGQSTVFAVGQFLSMPSGVSTVNQRLWALNNNAFNSTRLSAGGKDIGTDDTVDARLTAVAGTPFGSATSSFALNTTDVFLATTVADGTQADGHDTVILYANGNNVLQWTTASIDQDDDVLTIGAQTINGTLGLNGYLQEFILYGSLDTADREKIDSNLIQQYVPEPSSLVLILLGLGMAGIVRFCRKSR